MDLALSAPMYPDAEEEELLPCGADGAEPSAAGLLVLSPALEVLPAFSELSLTELPELPASDLPESALPDFCGITSRLKVRTLPVVASISYSYSALPSWNLNS